MSIEEYLKQNLISEDKEESEVDYQTQQMLDSLEKLGVRTYKKSDGTIIAMLYHGTSKANHTKIVKSNKLKQGTYLSHDEDTSKRYAKMTGSSKPTLMWVGVAIDGITFNGHYFTTTRDLNFNGGSEYV